MAKRFVAIALFLAILAAASVCLLLLNGLTPCLTGGGQLPSYFEGPFALSGVSWDAARSGYALKLRGVPNTSLVLTVADLDQVSILLWGEPIAAWGDHGPYQRVEQVALPAESIRSHGGIDLLFQSDSWGSRTQELFSRQPMTLAKLLLSSAQDSARMETLSFGITAFSMGLHVLLIASSLVLYARKPSEKYLLLLSVVAAVSLAATLLTATPALLPIARKTYRALRPLLSICPVMLHAAIGLLLFSNCAPRAVQKVLSVRALLLLTLAVIAARYLSSYSIYTAVRWVLMLPVVWTLSSAFARRQPGAVPMLVGYALSESVTVLLFLINNFQVEASGALLVYLHLNQMSYLFVLLASMLVINRRFADKFRESEKLRGELAAMNAGLDQLVEKRTLLLQEEQEAKHRMMTNIFHDIRSPIFILQGGLEQLRPSKEEQPVIDSMRSRLDFLKRLTEDLFLISKLEEDSVLYEESRIDLGELPEALLAINRGEALRRSIELAASCEKGLWVWADRQRLLQAFQNLLDNAFHYTPAGGSVRIWAQRKGSDALLCIRDTGAGIAEKDLPFLFDRYFKRSRADDPHSSGLGLYIAKEIVVHHRGTICATSAPGQGSCFTVRLPLLPPNDGV